MLFLTAKTLFDLKERIVIAIGTACCCDWCICLVILTASVGVAISLWIIIAGRVGIFCVAISWINVVRVAIVPVYVRISVIRAGIHLTLACTVAGRGCAGLVTYHAVFWTSVWWLA